MRYFPARGFIPLLLICLYLYGCGIKGEMVPGGTVIEKETGSGEPREEEKPEVSAREKEAEDQGSGEEEGKEAPAAEEEAGEGEKEVKEEKTFTFVDVHQNSYQAEYDPDVPRIPYDRDLFMKIGSYMTYAGDRHYIFRRGIDVSEFNGEIDWKKVKDAGMEFVFIRAGYRGYGSRAGLVEDKFFRKNLEGAGKAGLDIGLYFFSQALTPEEARQEADYLIKLLDGKKVSLPLVCDLEHIEFDQARTDDLTPAQATENVIAFCERIREKGYLPMFYSNLVWEAFGYELGKMTEIPIWYADYEAKPQTPYYFSFWQYSNEGRVDGIPSNVDLNIQMIPVS